MRLKIDRILRNRNVSSLTSNLIFSVSGFFSFVLLSQSIPPELFGGWILFLSLSSMTDLIRTGMTRAAIIHYASGGSSGKLREIGASGLWLDILLLSGISVICWGAYFAGHLYWNESIRLFFIGYPFLGFSNMLWNNALSRLQAQELYHKTIGMRLIQTLSFLGFCLVLVYYGLAQLPELVFAYVVSNILSSVYVLLKHWLSISDLRILERKAIVQHWHYGKYAVGSMLSSSLLKSSATYIIGLSPALGMTGISIFSIPFKTVEILEIPIRSLALNAFNRISVAYRDGKDNQIRILYVRYTIYILALTIPMLIGMSLLPDFVLGILGGKQYLPYWTTMCVLLWLIVPYTILLVFDRLLGVTMEGVGLPRLNMIKTLLMTFSSIIGNLIAVFAFQSIIGVAISSIFFTIIGISAGYWMLPRIYRINWEEYKGVFASFRFNKEKVTE